jgi:predicted DNA-binding transcriptional regulator AlpA
MAEDKKARAPWQFMRFRDLKEAGLVDNRPALKRMIVECGFPPGILLSTNTRAWRTDEIAAWLATRPTAPKQLPRNSVEPQPV